MCETLTADDRLEIKQALVLWGQYEDQGRAQDWANLFTPDGCCTYANGQTTVGREALAQASRERWAKPEARSSIHWMGDAVITGTGLRADVTNYCMVLDKTGGALTIKAVSQRSYIFVRLDGRWLIRERTYQALPHEDWQRAQP